jgi:hypothetical protein
MILSGLHKFKNALLDLIIFLDREFDLVFDVMPPTSREVGGMKVCIVVQIDKDC